MSTVRRAKIAKGLISFGVITEFVGTLLVVSDLRALGLTLGALAVVIVITGYALDQ